MVHCVRRIPAIIIIVVVIRVMNHYSIAMSSIVTAMVIVIIMMINTYRHHSECCKIGRIKSIIIGWIIRYINRGIYILHNGCLFNHHNGGCCRGRDGCGCRGCCCCRSCGSCRGHGRFSTRISRVGCGSRRRGLWFNNIIFSVQILIPYNLHGDFFILVF